MIAYFTRLLIKGVIHIFLAFVILHTLTSYFLGSVTGKEISGLINVRGPILTDYAYLIELLELDRPWPLSSLAWLFNPMEIERHTVEGGILSTGININIAGFPIQGSGVLTGDFGESLQQQRGTPAMDILGKWTDEYLFAHLAVIFAAMIIACIQRRGRPTLHELPSRLLPSISVTRSAIQAGAIHRRHRDGPLNVFTMRL
jgi:ABC-type dipeptide/oligopeptide/nickel transport system permease component